MEMIEATSDRQPTNARHGRLGLLSGAMAIALAIAGCTNNDATTPVESPAPATSQTSAPTASPTPVSVGPLAPTPLTVATGTNPGDAEGESLNIPQGWTAEIWANVDGARLAAWTPDGKLLVSSPATGAVVALTPTENGKAPKASDLLTGLNGPQGLGFALDGKVLVVGEENRIVAYDYLDGAATNPNVLVDNLPSDGHGAKGIAINGDTVYYSLGSSDNRSVEDRTADPERGTVWRVSIYGGSNEVVARGVRNGFALAIAPDKTLFSGVNQMDDQPYPFDDGAGQPGDQVRDYINENPVDQVSRLTQDVDLGWPYCVPDTTATPDLLNVPYVNDPQLNPAGDKLDCAALPPTMLGVPAHSAPLGLAFTEGTPLGGIIGTGALITTHGSWNRESPRPPGVVFSPWDTATQSLGVPVELVNGFQSDAGYRWGRSVTAIPGPDGSLYVTDDEAGLVYRITPG